jgi:hypothetical protein
MIGNEYQALVEYSPYQGVPALPAAHAAPVPDRWLGTYEQGAILCPLLALARRDGVCVCVCVYDAERVVGVCVHTHTHTDPAYTAFLKERERVPEALPSADVARERQETEARTSTPPPPTPTPPTHPPTTTTHTPTQPTNPLPE